VLPAIKSKLKRNIIGFVFNAHIIHNCAKTAYRYSTVVFPIILTYSYIHTYTVHVEGIKYACYFAGEEYQQILGYTKVRWL
jgi:hypothetical protein